MPSSHFNGCEKCIEAAYSGWKHPLAEVGTSDLRWGVLYKYSNCNAYWEQDPWTYRLLDEKEARKYYPDAFWGK